MAQTRQMWGLGIVVIGFLLLITPPLTGLSVTNTTTISGLTVTCAQGGSCVASETITNVNGTVPMTVYMVLSSSSGKVLSYNQQTLMLSQGQSQQVSWNMGTVTGNQLTVSSYVVSSTGYVFSGTTTYAFNAGTFILVVESAGNTGTTTPPAGTYTEPAGTVVPITFNLAPTAAFQGWQVFFYNPVGPTLSTCTESQCSSSSNPLSLTMDTSYDVQPAARDNTQYYATVTPQTYGLGSVSPSSAQNIYPTSAAGQTSATFTATNTISTTTFTGWYVKGTPIKSTANSITLTYSQLQPYISTNGAAFTLVANFTQYNYLYISYGPGVTTNPPTGSYPETPGVTVKITANINVGTNFCGWLVDGVNVGTANPINVVMNGPHNVTPSVSSGACTTSTTTGTSTSTSASGTMTATTTVTTTGSSGCQSSSAQNTAAWLSTYPHNIPLCSSSGGGGGSFVPFLGLGVMVIGVFVMFIGKRRS